MIAWAAREAFGLRGSYRRKSDWERWCV